MSQQVTPYTIAAGTYQGGGLVRRVMNFLVRSKKFNLIQDGRKNFLGHIDFLAEATAAGEFSCLIYTDYNDDEAVNQGDDTFFNRNVTTIPSDFAQTGKGKDWHRFFCPMDAQFFEFRLTLEDSQLADPHISENSEVEIDAFIIYSERGGRLVE
jgi:hypothetical protein